MSHPILRFSKRPTEAPPSPAHLHYVVREFDVSHIDSEIDHWLAIHNAVLSERSRSRAWTAEDFYREFSSFSNACPSRYKIWFAVRVSLDIDESDHAPVGTISCCFDNAKRLATINWLAVSAAHRRRGVASLLTLAVENYCWERSVQHITLTTLRTWPEAVNFYRRRAYQTASDE
ncbi:MAG: GNAT family N-acetyltransferase [Planctomycetales bacterium]|nr:GNAT family N-acetyltransferase [Planctomycetales bacterium]